MAVAQVSTCALLPYSVIDISWILLVRDNIYVHRSMVTEVKVMYLTSTNECNFSLLLQHIDTPKILEHIGTPKVLFQDSLY